MRKDWEIKSLDQIATVKGGKRVPKGYKFETTPTSHPYITVADFTEDGTVYTKNLKYINDEVYEQIKNYTISSQDIYISIAGTIGKTGSVPKSLDGANLTENACKLVLHKGIDKKFVYYFTKTDDFVQQTGINTRVAAQPKLALVRLKTITLPIPTLPEQQRIVAILDDAFEGIDKAIANTEKNLANSRELFESYLNAFFTQKGDGWVEKKLEDICKKITVGHVGSMASKYKDSGIPFLRSQNILPFR
ncbi:MAG: restriction endonuclease subunit S, partial [Cyanobacteria bacterium P01_D01_bin.50]